MEEVDLVGGEDAGSEKGEEERGAVPVETAKKAPLTAAANDNMQQQNHNVDDWASAMTQEAREKVAKAMQSFQTQTTRLVQEVETFVEASRAVSAQWTKAQTSEHAEAERLASIIPDVEDATTMNMDSSGDAAAQAVAAHMLATTGAAPMEAISALAKSKTNGKSS